MPARGALSAKADSEAEGRVAAPTNSNLSWERRLGLEMSAW